MAPRTTRWACLLRDTSSDWPKDACALREQAADWSVPCMDLSPLAIGQILHISCVLRKEGAFLSTLLPSFFLCHCYFLIQSLLKTNKLQTVSFLCGQGSGIRLSGFVPERGLRCFTHCCSVNFPHHTQEPSGGFWDSLETGKWWVSETSIL